MIVNIFVVFLYVRYFLSDVYILIRLIFKNFWGKIMLDEWLFFLISEILVLINRYVYDS